MAKCLYLRKNKCQNVCFLGGMEKWGKCKQTRMAPNIECRGERCVPVKCKLNLKKGFFINTGCKREPIGSIKTEDGTNANRQRQSLWWS
jgi:hypothetical protein